MASNFEINISLPQEEGGDKKVIFYIKGITNQVYFEYMPIFRLIAYNQNKGENNPEELFNNKKKSYHSLLDKLFSYIYVDENRLFGEENSECPFISSLMNKFNLTVIEMDMVFLSVLNHMYGTEKKKKISTPS